jgi:hypothetical protein
MFESMTTEEKGDGRDKFWEGDADDGVRRLAQELGWGDELEEMIKEGTERLGKEWADVSRVEDKDEELEIIVKEVGDVVGKKLKEDRV